MSIKPIIPYNGGNCMQTAKDGLSGEFYQDGTAKTQFALKTCSPRRALNKSQTICHVGGESGTCRWRIKHKHHTQWCHWMCKWVFLLLLKNCTAQIHNPSVQEKISGKRKEKRFSGLLIIYGICPTAKKPSFSSLWQLFSVLKQKNMINSEEISSNM